MKNLYKTSVLGLLSLVFLFFLGNTFPVNAQGGTATVTTDKNDYSPGSTAIITGLGFQPGEEVDLHVYHADGDPLGSDPGYHEPWTVIADANGEFTTSWYVPTAEEGDALGATLNLEAHGNMGSEASWTFTDSGSFGYNTTSSKSNTVSLSPGGSNNTTLGVTVDAPKNNGTIAVSLTFINTGSPSITIGTGTSQINLTSSVISFITGNSGIAHDFPISVSVGSSVASGSYSFTAYANGTGVQSAGGWGFTVVVGSTAGSIGTVSIGSQSGTSTYGTASSPTYAVTSTRGSNGTVNGTYSVSGLPAGVTSGGFSPSETFNSAGGDVFPGATLTLNVDANVGAGSYNFDIFLTDGASQASTQGTLFVSKKNLSVTAVTGDITYGDAEPTPTVEYAGFVNGDDAGDLDNEGFALGTDYNQFDAVGTYNTTIAIGTATDNNYNFTPLNSSTFEVGKLDLAVTAVTGDITYGDAEPTPTVEYAGFVNGDDAGDLDNEGFALGTDYNQFDAVGT
ncbi:MBG domain-containing protein, partial [Algoriphagus aquimarinus]